MTYPEVERIEVDAKFIEMAKRRVRALQRACCREQNVLETLALSCYLQGLEDGYEAGRPREVRDECVNE